MCNLEVKHFQIEATITALSVRFETKNPFQPPPNKGKEKYLFSTGYNNWILSIYVLFDMSQIFTKTNFKFPSKFTNHC